MRLESVRALSRVVAVRRAASSVRSASLACAVVLVSLSIGTPVGAQALPETLYERLGQHDGISAMADDFVERLVGDPRLGRLFAGQIAASRVKVRQLVVDLVCAAVGGPCPGPNAAQLGGAITAEEWAAALEHMRAALDTRTLPEDVSRAVLAALASRKDGLVQPDRSLRLPETPSSAAVMTTRPADPAYRPAPESGDTAVALLRHACGGRRDKVLCYSRELQGVVMRDGTERALDILEQLATVDPDLVRHGHPLAHEIGRITYQKYRDAPTALEHCRELFDSGCLHGILEIFLNRAAEVKREEFGTLCDGLRRRSRFLHFQCLHGLGHGLLMHFHDLHESLGLCDHLATPWERDSCHGGVFMENIVASHSPNPHHRHPHFLRPEEPLYPCSAVDPRYWPACYLIQAAAILHLNGWNFEKSFRDCLAAPPAFVPVCYRSMGRDISGFTLRRDEESIALCRLGSPPLVSACLEGVVRNVVNSEARPEPGLAFCRKVDAAYKAACYQALGEMVFDLYPDASQRGSACARADESYQDLCRSAARVNP